MQLFTSFAVPVMAITFCSGQPNNQLFEGGGNTHIICKEVLRNHGYVSSPLNFSHMYIVQLLCYSESRKILMRDCWSPVLSRKNVLLEECKEQLNGESDHMGFWLVCDVSTTKLVWVEKTVSDSITIKLVQMSPATSHSSLHHELR